MDPAPTLRHRISRTVAYAGLLALFAGLLVQPAGGQAASPPPQPPQLPSVDQEQFIPYWTTETGWHSELQLRNNLTDQDLTVIPALRMPDGVETALAPSTIKPQEVLAIDLERAIGSKAPQLIGTYGSVVLRYHSPGYRNLNAALMIRNVGHPFQFHIDAVGQSEEFNVGQPRRRMVAS